jgi:hypothetical protein
MDDARVVTVAEAVDLTGLSRRAIEGRIARGTLPAEKRGGRLFIPLVELYRQGLVPLERGSAEGFVIADLLERLERQAEEIGRLRAELDRSKRPKRPEA